MYQSSKIMSDYKKYSLELVGAGLRAGTLFEFGPAGMRGFTDFVRERAAERKGQKVLSDCVSDISSFLRTAMAQAPQPIMKTPVGPASCRSLSGSFHGKAGIQSRLGGNDGLRTRCPAFFGQSFRQLLQEGPRQGELLSRKEALLILSLPTPIS